MKSDRGLWFFVYGLSFSLFAFFLGVFFLTDSQEEIIYKRQWNLVVVDYFKSDNHGWYYLRVKDLNTNKVADIDLHLEKTGFGEVVAKGDTLKKKENCMTVHVLNKGLIAERCLDFLHDEFTCECN